MIAIIIIFILISIGMIWILSNNYKFKYDNFTFFEGSLGSGKTTIITKESIKEYIKRKWFNLLIANKIVIWFIRIITLIIPILNIVIIIFWIKDKKCPIDIKKRGMDIYSTYPIKYRKWLWSKWQYSIVIDRRLFNWLIKCNEDCIIALDELGYIFPPNTNNNGAIKMTEKQDVFGLTWLRHAISPCVFCASQSIDEVNITFRRKIQHIYRLSNNKKVLGRISKVSALEIQRSEDSGSIITTFKDTSKDYLTNWHYYIYPKNNFQSRYGKLLYNLEENDLKKVSYDYNYLLDLIGVKVGERWKSLYYLIK